MRRCAIRSQVGFNQTNCEVLLDEMNSGVALEVKSNVELGVIILLAKSGTSRRFEMRVNPLSTSMAPLCVLLCIIRDTT